MRSKMRNIIVENSAPRWSIVGFAIARSTLSGMLVGPGICRKWRPALCGVDSIIVSLQDPRLKPRLGNMRLGNMCAATVTSRQEAVAKATAQAEHLSTAKNRCIDALIQYRLSLSQVLDYRMRHRIYLHITWTTCNRRPEIDAEAASILRRLLPAIAEQERSRVIELGMVSTHVHALLRVHPTTSIPRPLQPNSHRLRKARLVSCQL
jgi:hypothetical protein